MGEGRGGEGRGEGGKEGEREKGEIKSIYRFAKFF